MNMIDASGRRINYLRLSVTDRCNLRCCYCGYPEEMTGLGGCRLLAYDSLVMLAEAAVELGIEKIRVTGGEPLMREGLLPFLERLSGISGLKELVLTTNGQLLEEMAGALRCSGVQRINISLDSLRSNVYSRITGGGDLRRVLAGIAAAERVGFPIKLNVVVMRGVNDAEVGDFASLTLNKPHTVRFIEYMPIAGAVDARTLLVSGGEILSALSERFLLCSIKRGERAGPASEYRIEGAAGAIGVITPVSGHFCNSCNRIRVTAAGIAKACLFGMESFDLRPFLCADDRKGLLGALDIIVRNKRGRHRLEENEAAYVPFAMSGIGG